MEVESMGTVHIKVTAEKSEMEFEWQGDDAAIRNVMEAVKRTAEVGGITPQAYTHSVLKHLPALTKKGEEATQEAVMMAVLHLILTLPAERSGRPGLIADYAADEDINAVFTCSNQDFSVRLDGVYTGEHLIQ
jgi:hypothetical protein